MPLTHQQLCALIPHSGTMCLLDSVIDWDEQTIRCSATSQGASDNPLREDGRVAAVNGVEYAAQAMAVHSALLDQHAGKPSVGYLAALRGVKLHAETLQGEAELTLHCTRLGGDSKGFIYQFEVHGAQALLLEGRATVIHEAGGKTA